MYEIKNVLKLNLKRLKKVQEHCKNILITSEAENRYNSKKAQPGLKNVVLIKKKCIRGEVYYNRGRMIKK